ncbi:MAG: hypothetical protein ACI4J8_10615, partial [Oscillospiraceae bacterium]
KALRIDYQFVLTNELIMGVKLLYSLSVLVVVLLGRRVRAPPLLDNVAAFCFLPLEHISLRL